MPDDVVSRPYPTVPYDHNSRYHSENWPEEYREMREKTPRAWSEAYGGFWVATKYKDIIGIAQKPDAFTTHKTFDEATGEIKGGASIPPQPNVRFVPNESESPEWNSVRTFLNRHFAPKTIDGWRKTARKYATALVDRVIEKGKCDVVEDLANPLPAIITMEMLGLGLHEWPEFADLFHKIVYLPQTDPDHKKMMDKLEYFLRQRVDEEIAIRRTAPKNDLFTHLANDEMDGKKLDRDMIHNLCFNIVGGGVGTTSALISNTLLYLSRNPADRERLNNDPSLWPVATEEFVRFFTVVHGPTRLVKEDVDVDGWKFKAGERVMVCFASANRDPEIFEEPDKIIIDRMPNRHIGFGAGMHRCIGSFFARMVFETMVTEVIKRLPDIKVDEANKQQYPVVALTNGWIQMPATFTPGKKVGETIPGV